MTVVAGFFPYDISNQITGPVRVVYAPTSVSVPADPKSIFLQESPYTLQTGWLEFGSTDAASVISRQVTVQDLHIEQTAPAVQENVTDVARTIQMPLTEVDPANLQLFEQGAAVTTIAAAGTGATAQNQIKGVPFGSLTSLTKYRVALIAMRDPAAGVVTEPSATRGRALTYCGFQCGLSADNAQASFGRNGLVSLQLTLKLFPESTKPAGEEFGIWWDEQSGTLA